MKIRKYCSRCNQRIDFENVTYYLSIAQREKRDNRDNCFLCKDCFNKFIKFMEN